MDLYDEQKLRVYGYLVSAAKDGGERGPAAPGSPQAAAGVPAPPNAPAQNRNGIMSGVLPKRCFGKLKKRNGYAVPLFVCWKGGQARSAQMGLDQAMCSSFWVTRR